MHRRALWMLYSRNYCLFACISYICKSVSEGDTNVTKDNAEIVPSAFPFISSPVSSASCSHVNEPMFNAVATMTDNELSSHKATSNGLAKRTVQTVKQRIVKLEGLFPSELLMGRKIRTRLDQFQPHSAMRMQQKQSIPENKVKAFIVGEKEFARAYSADDSTMRRHIDQLRPRTRKDDISMNMIEDKDIDDQGHYLTPSPIDPPATNPTPPSIKS
uniref:Uncharacterized protein n=1 Tax=Amphimedon queenslandica TaxID=400682 RepID=A0A1X7U517_AMPQE